MDCNCSSGCLVHRPIEDFLISIIDVIKEKRVSENIEIFGGKRALSLIRDKGLKPEMVEVVAGAAGGPKGLLLKGLDRFLFFSWFKSRKEPLFLIGSSIGAWRFAAVASSVSGGVYDSFIDAYVNQSYSSKPTPKEVYKTAIDIMNSFMNNGSKSDILSHACFRISMLSAICRWPVASDNTKVLSLGLLGAIVLNYIKRRNLRFFFKRALFYDPRDLPPFFEMDEFPIERIALNEDMLRHAILASGSIPLAMPGVKGVPGMPKGMYRDGSMIDYHLDIPFLKDSDKIALFPHFMNRIVPGWFDKRIKRRKPNSSNMDNVVVIAPSKDFIERLPYKRIPDRKDFIRFRGCDRERISFWSKAIDESQRMGDEFGGMVESGRIKDRIKPLFE